MAESDIVGILLAAGRGNRFGGDKLLAPLADGTPMALAVARKLCRACRQAITVLRPEQELLGEMLGAEGCRIIYSHEADFGMGHSLTAAVRSAHDAGGWLIALADMPVISAATYSLIVEALRDGASLAAPFYRGRRGHPVGFSRTWFDQLICLQGDEGARRILAEHASSLTPVPCVDPGILVDVDTPEELAKLVGSKSGG
jgi:molybdenum cofactor cytidylyltransferase